MLQVFQTPISCSTGLRVLPIKIEETIIMPPVIFPSSTNKAPKPKTRDCCETRTNLVTAVITPVFSLASACNCRKRLCLSNHIDMMLGNMPIASITSALRKLLVAKLPASIAMPAACCKGFLDTASFKNAKTIRTAVPHKAKTPNAGLNKNITTR